MLALTVILLTVVIETVSEDTAHDPLVMVHNRSAVVPATNPVIVEVADDGVVTVPDPDTTLHIPLPADAGVAVSVVDVILQIL